MPFKLVRLIQQAVSGHQNTTENSKPEKNSDCAADEAAAHAARKAAVAAAYAFMCDEMSPAVADRVAEDVCKPRSEALPRSHQPPAPGGTWKFQVTGQGYREPPAATQSNLERAANTFAAWAVLSSPFEHDVNPEALKDVAAALSARDDKK